MPILSHVRSPNYQQHQSSTSRHNTKQTIRFISPSVPSAYLCFSLGTTRSPFLSAPTMQCFPKRFGFKHTQPNIHSYTYTNTHQKKIHCVIYNFILRMKLTDTECISYNFSRMIVCCHPERCLVKLWRIQSKQVVSGVSQLLVLVGRDLAWYQHSFTWAVTVHYCPLLLPPSHPATTTDTFKLSIEQNQRQLCTECPRKNLPVACYYSRLLEHFFWDTLYVFLF